MEIAIKIIVGLLIVGGIYYAYQSKRRKDKNKAAAPVVTQPTPEPPEINNKEAIIVDTDMGPQSDPDDVQCYIAQASSWPSLFNALGIVSTVQGGKASGKAMITRVMDRLRDEVSAKYYKVYPVYENQAAIDFYKTEISKTGRPLTVFIWGSITTFEAAINQLPNSQLSHVTVYWVANWNRRATPEFRLAWERMKPRVKRFKAFYRDEDGFRGIMRGGDMSKLERLQSYILNSPAGKVYKDHPISAHDATYANKWKAGDLALYFYHRNKSFRDSLFRRDEHGGFVAEGQSAENAVASNGFRDEMIRVVKENVNRV